MFNNTKKRLERLETIEKIVKMKIMTLENFEVYARKELQTLKIKLNKKRK